MNEHTNTNEGFPENILNEDACAEGLWNPSEIAKDIIALTGKVCLSVKDTSEITTLSESTVKTLLAEKSIVGIRSNTYETRGSRWVIPVLSLATWIYNNYTIAYNGGKIYA